MKAAPIYVVVCATGGHQTEQEPDGGPIVMETDVGRGSTLDRAKVRAAALEHRYGACRIGRVVFEDEPGFAPSAERAPIQRRERCPHGVSGQNRCLRCD